MIEIYKKDKSYDNSEYIDCFTECVLEIYIQLREVKDGIAYFQKKYIAINKEIKEFVLLNIIEKNELYKEWITEYEKNLGKIKYRDSLKEQYIEYKNKFQ